MKNPMKAPPWIRHSAILAMCILALAAVGASSAWAATLTVTTLNDSDPGSLRQAILSAGSGDTIIFGVRGTITLTTGALTINKNLYIQGPGPKRLKISGNNASRVFVIQGGPVTISGMTISDGLADADSLPLPGMGGGILNLASLTLSDVVVSNNKALGDAGKSPQNFPGGAFGGGVANFGTLTVDSSSFIDNQARGGEGGIGGNGGDGLGGGLYDFFNVSTPPPIGAPPTVLNLEGATVTKNLALGGEAGNGGSEGQGIGGGIYWLGTYSADTETVIKKNQASTSHNNVYP